MKDRISKILFDSTFGSTVLGIICVVLFLITFGIGYIACGVMLLHHANKRNPSSPVGSGGFGVLFLWPIALLMVILDV